MPAKHPCKGKQRYASYDEAALALVDAKRREQRVYYCGDCNGHHLTSTPADGRPHAQ